MSTLHRLDPGGREDVIARIDEVLASRRDVAFGTVFGSFLDLEAFHDVDVGVWTAAQAGDGADVDLAASLSDVLRLPVDVRRLNDAPVPFLFHALRGRPVGVQDERLLADVMERTAREYHDRAPLLRRATREAFAG